MRALCQMHDEILDQIQKRWNDAAATWDIKALAQIYTPDAVFFGLLPRLYVGRSEVEEYFGSYRDVLEGVSLNLVRQNIRLYTTPFDHRSSLSKMARNGKSRCTTSQMPDSGLPRLATWSV